jgi:pimeloyl-ACP methyl ester carboxylesterase
MDIAPARFIQTAPDVRLKVHVAGRGPLVVLMHGWPELALSYRHQIGPLAAAGYTVAVPDMRGYGGSTSDLPVERYSLDQLADDMAAVADALGFERWVSVGHDWGAPAAWRTALRFPDRVAGVFGLSVPHQALGVVPGPVLDGFEALYPDSFFYVRYFQQVGPAERELEADPRAALRHIFHALSSGAPLHAWTARRPRDSRLLDGLDAPRGPLSFMAEEELDAYAAAYAASGFFGSLNWYRNLDRSADEARAYGDQRIRQPAGFLCGDMEITLCFIDDALAGQRALCDDLRCETVLPGAGHWIQQERPAEVTAALLDFLAGVHG